MATGSGSIYLPDVRGTGSGSVTVIVQPLAQASVTRYRAVISAPSLADYELPMSNFEMRLRQSPLQCYLSVTVPGILDHASAIDARADGELAVYQVLDGVETELLKTNVHSIRQDLGGSRRSGAVVGYKQKTFANPVTRALFDPTYKSVIDGQVRYRLQPRNINPGDAAYIDGGYVEVEKIVWYVSPVRAQMEISSG